MVQYRWSGPEALLMGEERVVFPCDGGNHGPMVVTYETETTSVLGTLVLCGPGVREGVRPPKGEQMRVCTTDIAPTLLAMAGAPAPEVDGIDLGPLLSAGEHPGQRQVRAEQFRPMASAHGWPHNRPAEIRYLFARKQTVVGGSLKRIVAADGSDSGYDLDTDPGEEQPFPGAETDLSAHIPEPQATAADVDFDPLQRKMLEVLGYLQ